MIDASGRDTRGQGNAKATIVVTMARRRRRARRSTSSPISSITGKVAQFGRGVLVDVSSKLMGQFVENLERDVLTSAGGGDTSHAGSAYEQALETVAPHRRNGVRQIDSPEAEPVDLFEMAGDSMMKRLVPVGIGAGRAVRPVAPRPPLALTARADRIGIPARRGRTS